MFVPRRALFTAQRLQFARARPIAPLLRYSTESTKTAAPSATDVPSTSDSSSKDSTAKPEVTLQKPSEDVAQVKQEDVSSPRESKYSKPAASSSYASSRSRSTTTRPRSSSPPTTSFSSTRSSAPKTFAGPPRERSGPSNPYKPATVAEQQQPSSDDRHGGRAPSHEIDWEKTWYGIGSRPVTASQCKILLRPVEPDDVEVKPDGIVYLPEVKYRRRLNEAFGPMGWGMVNRGDVVVGSNIVTREYGLVVNGRFVSQAQGVNNFFSPEGIPAAIEGCKSNALMRCCKDLGIASELWDPVFLRWFRKHYMEERWVEHVTTKKKRTFWYRKGLAEPVFPYKLV